MFNFCSLYSGSSGNSLLVQTSNTKILIDVGESCKKISNALSNIEIEPNSIDAIIVTHEHSDHIKGLGTFSKKYNVPVFANNKTWDAILKQTDKIEEKNGKLRILFSYPFYICAKFSKFFFYIFIASINMINII